jgi:amino acid transporter
MPTETNPTGSAAVEYRREGSLVIESIDVRERDVDHLHEKAVGLIGVLFLAVTGAAPLTAMLGNVPFAVGFGNGIGIPAAFWFATVVLTIFSVGYVAMARKLTASGGFYSFISHGLGRPLGLAAGWTAMACYVVFEASLMGIFAFFANATVDAKLGINIPWEVWALGGVALISILTYFDVKLSVKILGVALITEVLILLVMDFGVLFSGGGPDGLDASPLTPAEGFSSVAGGVAAVGIFMAFWSWAGFEATVNYGEESRNPKKIVPRATYIAVVGLGVFYTFTSWMVISGHGLSESITAAQESGGTFFYVVTDEFAGGFAKDLMEWLILTGSFACGMAFHNAASRYFYNLGRERVLPARLGRTHPRWHSPYMGSFFQSFCAGLIVLAFIVLGKDPYLELYVWLAVLGTFALLLLQTLCSIATIAFFERNHKDETHWWRTRLAPVFGAIGMGFALWLLIDNITAIGGTAGFIKAVPIMVGVWFLIGLALAIYIRSKNPRKYEVVGRMVNQGID